MQLVLISFLFEILLKVHTLWLDTLVQCSFYLLILNIRQTCLLPCLSLYLLCLQLEEGEDFTDVLNPCTKKETLAYGDSNMRNLKRGEVLQLERKGYFRCDVPFVRPSKPIVLFAIPDGRQQTSLK